MRLRDLLADPGLGLALIPTGADDVEATLGRLVTIDLIDPGRYLSGGEVILTGLVWRRHPRDSETFVKSLAERGARLLLAGRALLGDIPDDLVDACRRYAVTLVAVPAEVSFADVTEHVLRATSSAESAGLARQRALLSAMAAGRSLDELAARVSADIGHTCRVLTSTGRHVVPGATELESDVIDGVTRAFLVAERLPTVAEERYSVFAIGSGLDTRLGAWLLVVEGDHRTWSRQETDAVGQLCAIAALDRSRREEGLRTMQPIAAESLAAARRGDPAHEVCALLRRAGLPADGPLVAIALSLTGSPTASADAPGVLEDLAQHFGPPVWHLSDDGTAIAVLPGSAELPDRVRTCVERLRPGLGRERLAVGLSQETRADALAGALDQARFAHGVAAASHETVSIVSSGEVTSHVRLLAAVPDDVRRTYAQEVLGAMLDHDRRSQGDLLPTLTEFLACSGSWSRTAARLHLHVNTVRYRIQRIEELTGKDLSRLEDRVDVYLALESL